MSALTIALIVIVVLMLMAFGVKVVKQYERGVVLRFGRLVGVRNPGLNSTIHRVNARPPRRWRMRRGLFKPSRLHYSCVICRPW